MLSRAKRVMVAEMRRLQKPTPRLWTGALRYGSAAQFLEDLWRNHLSTGAPRVIAEGVALNLNCGTLDQFAQASPKAPGSTWMVIPH